MIHKGDLLLEFLLLLLCLHLAAILLDFVLDDDVNHKTLEPEHGAHFQKINLKLLRYDEVFV